MTGKNETGALIRMTLSMLIFGTIGVFRRYLPLSSALLACARGLAGALFLMVFVLLSGRKPEPGAPAPERLRFILCGCMIGLNWVFLFEAYRYTTVGIATLCYYMQPTIVMLLSQFLFREKLTVRKLFCAFAAAAGMILISGAAGGGGDLRGILYGLAAACLYAGVVITNKKAPPADAYEKTILQLLFAGLILLPYVLVKEDIASVHMNAGEYALLAVVCLVHTGIAYMLYFNSMPGLKAQTIAVLGYVDPVFALLLSALFLREAVTPLTAFGALLIIGAAIYSETERKENV